MSPPSSPESSSTPSAADPAAAPTADTDTDTGVILVADDEETVRRVASRALGNSGHEVVLASDGAEAVERFREQAERVDVVVLDVTMPSLNGREALEAIRGIDADVPAILMSGFAGEDLGLERPGLQATFLQKPFEVRELRDAVREAIELRRGAAG